MKLFFLYLNRTAEMARHCQNGSLVQRFVTLAWNRCCKPEINVLGVCVEKTFGYGLVCKTWDVTCFA